MDLIYTNKHREDVGVMKDYAFDLAYGSDENDFELSVDTSNHCCDTDCLIYIEGTEYGGIIDGFTVTTTDRKLVYKGRTWHGILASKILQPDDGEAYLKVSGEANAIIGSLLERVGLTDLFEVTNEYSGLIINNYSFSRYTDMYTGITKMLDTVGGKLRFTFKADKVVISTVPIVDYSQDEQFDNDQVEMTIEKSHNTVNHLICLGKGELTERQIVHLYVDAEGNISGSQTFTGIEEVADIYDYSNAESLEELTNSGKDKLKEYAAVDKVQMNFSSEEIMYDIGDIIGAKEIITGITSSAKISKKIVTISQGLVNIQYKVGE